MNPSKVEAIQKIKRPSTKTNVRAFLGLAGYYKHFIKNYAQITRPLLSLVGKEFPDKNIPWSAECGFGESFGKLKKAISDY